MPIVHRRMAALCRKQPQLGRASKYRRCRPSFTVGRWLALAAGSMICSTSCTIVLVDGTRQDTEALHEEIARVLAPMGLRLSPAKTQVVHLSEGFDFLGFHIQWRRKRGTNKWYVYTFIADRPVRSVKAKIRHLLCRPACEPFRYGLRRCWGRVALPGIRISTAENPIVVEPGLRVPASIVYELSSVRWWVPWSAAATGACTSAMQEPRVQPCVVSRRRRHSLRRCWLASTQVDSLLPRRGSDRRRSGARLAATWPSPDDVHRTDLGTRGVARTPPR